MPRRAALRFVSLRSCLVNLPISVYGPLVEHQIRPQSLAIHLSKPSSGKPSNGNAVYVGWTGMASASSLAMWKNSRDDGSLETLEIDPQFAASLGFMEGDAVEIGLLHDLPIAKSVSTEPLTADDWEILELHADYVEHNLLAQVRVAAVDQEIDVWVLGRTRIRFKVVTIDPPAAAVILSTDTEVSIAPKTRAPPTSLATTKAKPAETPNVVAPSDLGNRSSYKSGLEGNRKTEPLVMRFLPSCFAPSQLSDTVDGEAVAWISPSAFKRLVNLDSLDLSNQPTRHASASIIHSPFSLSADNTGPSPSSNPATAPSAKIFQAADPASNSSLPKAINSEPAVQAKPHFRLQASLQVPERHVAFSFSGVHQLDRLKDWDLVKLDVSSDTVEHPRERSQSPTMLPVTHKTSKERSLLAGVDTILNQAHDYLLQSFAVQGQSIQSSSFSTNLRPGIPGLLLCGAAGSGRTSVAKEVARALESDKRIHSYTLYIDLAKYSEERVAVLQSKFRNWLDIALWHQPSIIILDNLDKVVAAEVEHADSFRSRHIAELFISVFAPSRTPLGVALVGTCQSQAALHPLLSTAHLFGTRLVLKAPGKDARRDILSRLVELKLSSADIRQDTSKPLNYVALATQTEGYSATDLKDLVGRAVHQCIIRTPKDGSEPILTSEDFVSAQVGFTPLSLRDIKLQTSEVQWSDIGGLHETRKILRETLEWPTKYGAIFAKCPLRLRSGLLLYGFPGCGKTLLASAVAKECGLNFISVKGPELLNKYIGASEKSVRDIFDRASAAKPCVLFFDEFDSIAPKRGHDSTGVTDRVVNQMLTQMDGAEGLDGVYVLAATSRPDLIDAALLRPGRLDKSLLCGMPEEHERLEILQALSRKIAIHPDASLEDLAKETEGFSGADLQALMYNAHLDVVHERITDSALQSANEKKPDTGLVRFASFGGVQGNTRSKAEESALTTRMETMMRTSRVTRSSVPGDTVETPSQKKTVEERHLRKSLQGTRPSVSSEERVRLERIYRGFVSERSGELPVPPESMAIGTRESLG